MSAASWLRTCSSMLRMVPSMYTDCGMTLSAVPPRTMPTVITEGSSGEMRRDGMAYNALSTWLLSQIGSSASCG